MRPSRATHEVREGQVLNQRTARKEVPLFCVGVFADVKDEFRPVGDDLRHWGDAKTK